LLSLDKLDEAYDACILLTTFIFSASVESFVILHVYTDKFIFNAQVFVITVHIFGIFIPFVVTWDFMFIESKYNTHVHVNHADVIILGVGII